MMYVYTYDYIYLIIMYIFTINHNKIYVALLKTKRDNKHEDTITTPLHERWQDQCNQLFTYV